MLNPYPDGVPKIGYPKIQWVTHHLPILWPFFVGASQGLVVSVGLLQMLLPQTQQPLHLRTLRTFFASMAQDSRGPGDADEVLQDQMGPEKTGKIWENPVVGCDVYQNNTWNRPKMWMSLASQKEVPSKVGMLTNQNGHVRTINEWWK